MNESSNLLKMFILNTLGEAVLVETLRSAAYFFQHSSKGIYRSSHYRDQNLLMEGRQCYIFIQGTGLDILIEGYNLDYNANYLRDRFNYILTHAS